MFSNVYFRTSIVTTKTISSQFREYYKHLVTGIQHQLHSSGVHSSCNEDAQPISKELGGQWNDRLEFVMPDNSKPIPTYRVMDSNGRLLDGACIPQLDESKVVKMYKCMIQLNTMDRILHESQRQGRISFYMTCFGEEAALIGSAAALQADDIVYTQYRETGVLLWRGFTVEDVTNQCYGNIDDSGKARQMPMHFSSREHNCVTISSPLTTQLPQAVGTAYALKLAAEGNCVIVYFGDGAASEGDAHAAFNFAATLSCPVIFFCRNNGYAISTPIKEQYRGDGIAGRAAGYGMPALRVDGNDLFAVYNATEAAREFCTNYNRPVILEAMTYRVGHHSTSDDSTAYRPIDEINFWQQNNNPLTRLKMFLLDKNWWDESADKDLLDSSKKLVLKAIAVSENKLKPEWQDMFNDVYLEMPRHIRKQLKYMEDHVKLHNDHYPVDKFKKSL